jgi:multidrug efflux pump subunit AcrB
MNISEPFIRRPVMTILLMVGLVIFGMFGYSSLPVSELPSVDFPTIVISASLPGADPETMASAVATPLENQFSTIAGVSSMTSSSTQGSTQITIQFDLDRNIDGAAQDVQAAISAAGHQLPQNMPTPPTMRKVNPSDSPIMYLAMGSPTLPLSEVDKYAETLLARQISTLNGVAQVNVYGSQKFAVRIQADPVALAARQRRQSKHSDRLAQRQYAIGRRAFQRPARERRCLQQADHRLQERRARARGGCGPRHKRRREQVRCELVQSEARHRSSHSAPAGIEHHRGGGRDQEHLAAFHGAAAGNGVAERAL